MHKIALRTIRGGWKKEPYCNGEVAVAATHSVRAEMAEQKHLLFDPSGWAFPQDIWVDLNPCIDIQAVSTLLVVYMYIYPVRYPLVLRTFFPSTFSNKRVLYIHTLNESNGRSPRCFPSAAGSCHETSSGNPPSQGGTESKARSSRLSLSPEKAQ